MEGWLYKYAMGKLGWGKNWKKRFFKSGADSLTYSETESSKPKGTLLYKDVVCIYPKCDSPSQLPSSAIPDFFFALETVSSGSNLKLILRAETEAQRNSWVDYWFSLFGLTRIGDEKAVVPNKTDASRPRSISLFVNGARGVVSTTSSAIDSVKNTVKSANSRNKNRLTVDGFDLDLAYITDRIIAMGFPSKGVESVYRNFCGNVQDMLEQYHSGKYKVYNLCSERGYSDLFNGNFALFPFEDHNAPPIDLMQVMVSNVLAYFDENPGNVVAIHCKAGKGRTGTMICCLLLALKIEGCETTQKALEYYGMKRTKDGKGLTIPSQKRYVRYFEYINRDLKGASVKPKLVELISISFSHCPRVKSGGCNVLYTILQRDRNIPLELLEKFRSASMQKCEGGASVDIKDIPVNVPLMGDIKFLFTHKSWTGEDRMFNFWMNTHFIPDDGFIKLQKLELDYAHKDKKSEIYDPDFFIMLRFRFVSA